MKTVTYNDGQIYRYNSNKNGYDRLEGIFHKIVSTILCCINATITAKFASTLQSLDGYGNPAGPMNDVLYSTAEILMVDYLTRDYWKYQAYPYNSDKINIISLKVSIKYDTESDYILSLKFWITIFSICLVIVLILKYILKQIMISATLEFLRVIIGTSTLNYSRSASSRIFLIILIIALFDLSCIIQSRLSAVITVPKLGSKIDTINDLLNSNNLIFGYTSLKILIYNSTLRERYLPVNNMAECSKQLFKRNPVVCLCALSELESYFFGNPLVHVSKENIIERSSTYTLAKDWPLRYKFNKISSGIHMGGFIKFFQKQDHSRFSLKQIDKDEAIKSLSVMDLAISFYILFGGWASAIFTSILEIIFFSSKEDSL